MESDTWLQMLRHALVTSAEVKMRGRVAGNLKALQANLRHLTWQAPSTTWLSSW